MRDLSKELQTNISLIEKAGGTFTVDTKLSTEVNLSRSILVCETMNLKESVSITESKRIDRKNGGSQQITEASTPDLREQVERFKRSYGMTAAEVLLSLHPERAMQNSWAMSHASEKEFREGWNQFADILTPTEIDGLVRSRVNAPKKK